MTDARRIVVDTNILLAASDPSRPHHREAFEVLQRWPGREATLYASGQVLREYLAVATRPLQANGLGLTRAEALDNVHQLLRRLHLLDEDGRAREELLTLVRDIAVAGKADPRRQHRRHDDLGRGRGAAHLQPEGLRTLRALGDAGGATRGRRQLTQFFSSSSPRTHGNSRGPPGTRASSRDRESPAIPTPFQQKTRDVAGLESRDSHHLEM